MHKCSLSAAFALLVLGITFANTRALLVDFSALEIKVVRFAPVWAVLQGRSVRGGHAERATVGLFGAGASLRVHAEEGEKFQVPGFKTFTNHYLSIATIRLRLRPLKWYNVGVMKAIIILTLVISSMSILALPPIPASLPPVVHSDMEVATNIAISSWQYGAMRFAFSLSCLATPSNNVEVALGKDGNANGKLEPEETDLVVGWSCGTWFVQNGIDGERFSVASESPSETKTLAWSYRLTAARTPARLAVTADDGVIFETLSEESPSWLYDRNWDLMHLTARGLEDSDGTFTVGTPLNPTFIMFR